MKKLSVLQEDIESIISDEKLFEKLKNSTVMIAGATGLIGSALVRSLHGANEKYCLNMKIAAQIRNRIKAEMLFGSLLESDDIKLVFSEDIGCDYIIHTVSPTASKYFVEHPAETIKTAVESTLTFLEAARKNNAVMVYLSSMEQYGVPYEPNQIMTEDKIGQINHLNIRSCYSESKRLCECLCVSYASEYSVDVKIARLSQTFGAGVPMTDNRMPMQFAKAAVNGTDIILHTEGKSISNFVYLSDAVAGILTILVNGVSGEAYNICNDKETKSVREIAEMVADKCAGKKINVRVEIPHGINMGYAPDVKMYLCSDKLKALGWNPKVDMTEAYQRLVKYIRDSEHEN